MRQTCKHRNDTTYPTECATAVCQNLCPPWIPGLVPFEGNSDPFAATANPMSAASHYIVRLAQRIPIIALQAEAGRQPAFRIELSDSDHCPAFMQQAIADEGVCHAMLACGYYLKRTRSSLTLNDADNRETYHKANSISLLRERLQKGACSSNLVTMLHLLTSLAFDSKDFTAVEIYLRCIQSVLATLRPKDEILQNLLLRSSSWLAVDTLCPTLVPLDSYDPGELDITFKWETKGGTRLGSQVDFGAKQIDPCLRAFAEAADDCVRVKRSMSRINNASDRLKLTLWLERRATVNAARSVNYFCKQRRLGDEAQSSSPAAAAEYYLNAASIMALMVLTSIMFLDCPQSYDNSSRTRIIEQLLQKSRMAQNGCSNPVLRLWTTFILALAYDVFGGKGDIAFSGCAVHQSRLLFGHIDDLSIMSFAEYFHTRGFPYYSPIMDRFLEKLLAGGTGHASLLPWPEWYMSIRRYSEQDPET